MIISAVILAGLLGGMPHVLPAGQAQRPALPQTQIPSSTMQTQTRGQAQATTNQPAMQAGFASQTGANAATQPCQAMVVGTSNNTATVKFANGTTQTYTIDANTRAALKGGAGRPIAFRVVKKSLQIANDVKWATLAAVHNGVVTLRDTANKTEDFAVNAATAAQLRASVGHPIAFTINGNTLVFASEAGS